MVYAVILADQFFFRRERGEFVVDRTHLPAVFVAYAEKLVGEVSFITGAERAVLSEFWDGFYFSLRFFKIERPLRPLRGYHDPLPIYDIIS